MKTMNFRKSLSCILCIVLITAMALLTIGCNDNKETEFSYRSIVVSDGAVIGDGAVEFPLEIVDNSGKVTTVTVKTDKTTVGEALLELELIAGDNDQYGLYVKSVNGTYADYNKTGTYWAFYINGEYAMTGVDTTDIVAGDNYALKVEK